MNRRPWTMPEHNAFVRDYALTPNDVLAERHGRTKHALDHRARKYGLQKHESLRRPPLRPRLKAILAVGERKSNAEILARLPQYHAEHVWHVLWEMRRCGEIHRPRPGYWALGPATGPVDTLRLRVVKMVTERAPITTAALMRSLDAPRASIQGTLWRLKHEGELFTPKRGVWVRYDQAEFGAPLSKTMPKIADTEISMEPRA